MRARATEIQHICSTLGREVPIEAIFFTRSPSPGCHNCVAPIDADPAAATPRIATLRGRSNVINGISTGRRSRACDSRTITVTVTIMADDNDGRNSDSSIFVRLAKQYRSNTRHLPKKNGLPESPL